MNMNLYPKHFIVFGNSSNAFEKNKVTGENNYILTIADIGDNIRIERDLHKTFNTAEITLPSLQTELIDTFNLKKYDVFQIYFKYFNTKSEAESASIMDLDLIFDGYIEETPISESKMNGLVYGNLKMKSTAGLLYEISTQIPFFKSTMEVILDWAHRDSNLYIPGFIVDKSISPNWLFNINASNYLGEVFDNMRKNYAIQIFQKYDSYISITLPSTFKPKEEAFIMDLNENVTEIDYGDTAQHIDTVIVLGTNCIGIAFDPIAYQLKRGVIPEDLKNSVIPDKSLLNPRMLNRRDLFSEEDCQRVAREELLKTAKNYTITLKCKFDSSLELGDNFIVINSKKLSPNQIWTVKHQTIDLSKGGGAMMTIIGYSHSLEDYPEDILLSPEGVLDTDILGVTSKAYSAMRLHE